MFPEASVFHFPRTHSDHHPILLCTGGFSLTLVHKPFHFEAAWMTHEDFKGVVAGAWSANSE